VWEGRHEVPFLALLVTAPLIPLGWPPDAQAQQRACVPYEKVKQELVGKYQETQRFVGLDKSQHMMTVFASPKGTWTLMRVSPYGEACVVAVGEAFQLIPQAEKSKGSSL
jgi:hypothetical protein